MQYDTEHKKLTREKVVRKTADAIREFEPDKISVADLMAKVGFTHGGFYAHFKSKDDLVCEAISHIFKERHEALAVSVFAEMVGAMVIARTVSGDEASERILDAVRSNIKAHIGLAVHTQA